MSRIHEALKRAELERTGAAPVNVSPAPSDRRVNSGTETSKVAPVSATSVLAQPQRVATVPEGALLFSDIVAHCAHPEWSPDPKINVFSDPDLSVDGAEQFRTLRSRIYQMRGDQPFRTLLITSSLSGEGKTFVTSNLAHAIVRQYERRALLIDGDLRCSRLHVPLRAPASPGLSDYLRGDADLFSVIQYGHQGNLCFIPGGSQSADPSELLANGRMKLLLDRVASAFDWVLIDSPPCLPVADANVLAELCDGVLFVVKAHSTPAAVVEKAGREMQGRNVIGVIMNHVAEQTLGYSSYYRSGYHDPDNAGASEE